MKTEEQRSYCSHFTRNRNYIIEYKQQWIQNIVCMYINALVYMYIHMFVYMHVCLYYLNLLAVDKFASFLVILCCAAIHFAFSLARHIWPYVLTFTTILPEQQLLSRWILTQIMPTHAHCHESHDSAFRLFIILDIRIHSNWVILSLSLSSSWTL